MTCSTLLGALRRVGALALAVGALGVVACSNDEPNDEPTKDCDDCGASCPDPTCLSAEVDIEIRNVLPNSSTLPQGVPISNTQLYTYLPPFPLEIVVSFEGAPETYRFAGAQAEPDEPPAGPCTDANGEPAPALCRVERAPPVIFLKARSSRPEIYGDTKRVADVAIKDGEGNLLFSFDEEILLDGRVAPSCRPIVDPAQCGYSSLSLYAPPTPPPAGG